MVFEKKLSMIGFQKCRDFSRNTLKMFILSGNVESAVASQGKLGKVFIISIIFLLLF